ncbi:MAG TPA: hypothetical protein ENK25_04450 [Bacteroidetes bacterium]|nr:hypothetical protein [Bacteroidota bacterium]
MQAYHSNATTNVHIRCQIQKSHLPVNILAEKYQISENTVSKWKSRTRPSDIGSRPHHIHYALSSLEQELIKSVRRATWLPLDEITEVAQQTQSIRLTQRCVPNPTCSRAKQSTAKRAGKGKEIQGL